MGTQDAPQSPSDPDLIAALDAIAETVWRIHGLPLWFVHIEGKRWAWLTGHRPGGPSHLSPQRVVVTPMLGLVCAGWETLAKEDREAVIQAGRAAAEGGGTRKSSGGVTLEGSQSPPPRVGEVPRSGGGGPVPA